MVSMKKKSVDKRQDESIKEIIEKAKAHGYVSFMIKTEDISAEEHVNVLKKMIGNKNLSVNVAKEITLDGKPLCAVVVLMVTTPVKENITKDQANEMIEIFMKKNDINEEVEEI